MRAVRPPASSSPSRRRAPGCVPASRSPFAGVQTSFGPLSYSIAAKAGLDPRRTSTCRDACSRRRSSSGCASRAGRRMKARRARGARVLPLRARDRDDQPLGPARERRPGSHHRARLIRAQCRKWRRPVKTMAAPARSTASITSASRFEPPGWMIARTPASSASCGPSANGKNASEASAAPAVVAELARLLERDPHGVDAAHLAGADPDRLQVARDDDRVRDDVLADAPGEEQVAPVVSVGSPQTTSIPSRSSTSASRSWTSSPPSTRR